MINPPSASSPNWGISASPHEMAALCPWRFQLPSSAHSWTPPCPSRDVDTKKIRNSHQPCFLYKDNLLLTPVVSREGSLSGNEHGLVKIHIACSWISETANGLCPSSPSRKMMKKTVEKRRFFCIDANPANSSQMLLTQIPNLPGDKGRTQRVGNYKAGSPFY